MTIKKQLASIFRNLNILDKVDKIRFYLIFLKNYKTNSTAKNLYPNFAFPPAYYIYETYHLDYKDYYLDGKQTAKEIIECLSKHKEINSSNFKILDWGCGPARVIRHIANELSQSKCYGSDYNQNYISWCSQNIKNVTFIKNNLEPPLLFPSIEIDAIYSLSIITHLSEQNHFAWIDELYRVLKPGGILIITCHGDFFKSKLTDRELNAYNNGQLVVRETNIEGNRSYSAFQPKQFMKKLLSEFTILEFIEGNSPNSIHGEQDTWIVQKK